MSQRRPSSPERVCLTGPGSRAALPIARVPRMPSGPRAASLVGSPEQREPSGAATRYSNQPVDCLYSRFAGDQMSGTFPRGRHPATQKGSAMAKYLFRGNYKGDGIKGLMNEGGSKRREAANAAFESVGGKIDCMYYAFGDTDLYGICDLPDVASAAALSLMINSSAALTVNFTPLLTVEDVDAAMTKSPSYRPPGT